jgi:hypothetical protein
MHVDYQAVVHDVSVLSISAKAGEGGLLFDVEFTEWPNDTSVTFASPSRVGVTGALFDGLAS